MLMFAISHNMGPLTCCFPSPNALCFVTAKTRGCGNLCVMLTRSSANVFNRLGTLTAGRVVDDAGKLFPSRQFVHWQCQSASGLFGYLLAILKPFELSVLGQLGERKKNGHQGFIGVKTVNFETAVVFFSLCYIQEAWKKNSTYLCFSSFSDMK